MSFTFQPLSEEEIKALNIIEPGIYDFEVLDAQEKISKSGNPMIEMQIKVWDLHGKEKTITDYMVSTPKMLYKVKHFCDSVGLTQKYESGSFAPYDCIGKTGKLNLTIQKSNDYPDKNSIKDYVVYAKMEGSNVSPIKKDDSFINDDLPF